MVRPTVLLHLSGDEREIISYHRMYPSRATVRNRSERVMRRERSVRPARSTAPGERSARPQIQLGMAATKMNSRLRITSSK